MSTKSVKVPKYLKQKMAEHKEVNWSEVTRNAMYDHLSKIEKPIEKAETPATENKVDFKNVFASMDRKKIKTIIYVVGALFGLMVIIAYWEAILIGGALAGLVYLIYKRRHQA